jgi:hypothetical protein
MLYSSLISTTFHTDAAVFLLYSHQRGWFRFAVKEMGTKVKKVLMWKQPVWKWDCILRKACALFISWHCVWSGNGLGNGGKLGCSRDCHFFFGVLVRVCVQDGGWGFLLFKVFKCMGNGIAKSKWAADVIRRVYKMDLLAAGTYSNGCDGGWEIVQGVNWDLRLDFFYAYSLGDI